jgi:hypothetical protein
MQQAVCHDGATGASDKRCKEVHYGWAYCVRSMREVGAFEDEDFAALLTALRRVVRKMWGC